MAVYIIVALVAVAVLWAAYRVLGRASSATPDNIGLMRRAAGAAVELAAGFEDGRDAGRSERRTLEGALQLLERVDSAALDESQLAAHALLISAVEGLSWRARLRDTAAFGTNPGLQEACAVLRAHARRCLDEAAPLLRSAAPEEVDSPA